MHAPSASHATSIRGSSGDSVYGPLPIPNHGSASPSVSPAHPRRSADHGCTRPSESPSRVPGQRLPPSPISRQAQPTCQPATRDWVICGKIIKTAVRAFKPGTLSQGYRHATCTSCLRFTRLQLQLAQEHKHTSHNETRLILGGEREPLTRPKLLGCSTRPPNKLHAHTTHTWRTAPQHICVSVLSSA